MSLKIQRHHGNLEAMKHLGKVLVAVAVFVIGYYLGAMIEIKNHNLKNEDCTLRGIGCANTAVVAYPPGDPADGEVTRFNLQQGPTHDTVKLSITYVPRSGGKSGTVQ